MLDVCMCLLHLIELYELTLEQIMSNVTTVVLSPYLQEKVN